MHQATSIEQLVTDAGKPVTSHPRELVGEISARLGNPDQLVGSSVEIRWRDGDETVALSAWPGATTDDVEAEEDEVVWSLRVKRRNTRELDREEHLAIKYQGDPETSSFGEPFDWELVLGDRVHHNDVHLHTLDEVATSLGDAFSTLPLALSLLPEGVGPDSVWFTFNRELMVVGCHRGYLQVQCPDPEDEGSQWVWMLAPIGILKGGALVGEHIATFFAPDEDEINWTTQTEPALYNGARPTMLRADDAERYGWDEHDLESIAELRKRYTRREPLAFRFDELEKLTLPVQWVENPDDYPELPL